jgi:hypothetical protein
MSYRDFVPFDEDTEVAIKRETLEGLRDAYITVATTQSVGPGPYEALESWIEGVLEEAGMAVRVAIQKDWQERKALRDAERDLRVAMSRATSGNVE